MRACPSCGEANPDRFTDCAFCGTALVPAEAPQEERKVLTVVFCDLKDSTALGETLDPEALGEVLDLYFTSATRVLQRHGGTIQKFIGDAIVAAFGLPVIHEDDALRAVRAAIEMRDALARLNRQLQAGYGIVLETRTGVHTGEVVVRVAVNEQQILTGDTLNTAARLEQAAAAGEILIGEPTMRLVRGAVETEALPPLELKGKSSAVPAYRLIRVFGDEQADRRHDAPLVGREAELATLVAQLDRAVAERRCLMATVVGEAGVGKSRLVRELLTTAEDRVSVLRGRCLPYGEGITFWPLLDIVRGATGIGPDEGGEVAIRRLEAVAADPEIARRVASALGWSTEQLPVAELFWGLRSLLEKLARRRPLIVVVDDVHWAAPTLLELLEHLMADISDAPLLLVCTARPDMLDALPSWSDGPSAMRLVLEGLPSEACALVLENRVGGVELPGDARDRILRAADGNPLFVEQLVSMLIDTGILRRHEDHWEVTREIDELAIPPSIQALLSARLDMLESPERAVIEPASVIGEAFLSLAVRDLTVERERDHVPEHLAAVTRKRLVREEPDADIDGADYRFQHVLIRDAAYQSVLKRARADLHERYADWLEGVKHADDGQAEMDEVIGYHLEQAHAYRTELGPPDDMVRRLGARAANRLSAAGRRAFTRGDLPAAANLLGRAMGTLPDRDPARLALGAELGEVLLERGDFERALTVLAEGAAAEDDPACAPTVARARLLQLLVDLYAGHEEGWIERARAEVDRTIPVFTKADDNVGLATAWRVRWNADILALNFDAGFEAAEAVMRHADRAGDVRLQRRGVVAYTISAVEGSTPVEQAIARCHELIAAVEGDRRTEAVVRGALAQLLAMRGEAEEARREGSLAREMLVELGESVVASSSALDSGPVELLSGDPAAAEALLRRDYDELEALGESYLRSTIGGLLAYALVLLDRFDEAEAIVAAVREMAGPDDVDAHVLWRRALGRLRAAQGQYDEAIGLLTEAVELTSEAASVMRAYALNDRAIALAQAGQTDAAAADSAEALRLHEAKGNLASAAAVRRRLDAPPSTPAAATP